MGDNEHAGMITKEQFQEPILAGSLSAVESQLSSHREVASETLPKLEALVVKLTELSAAIGAEESSSPAGSPRLRRSGHLPRGGER